MKGINMDLFTCLTFFITPCVFLFDEKLKDPQTQTVFISQLNLIYWILKDEKSYLYPRTS